LIQLFRSKKILAVVAVPLGANLPRMSLDTNNFWDRHPEQHEQQVIELTAQF
jgi:hypothetical protein